ncbi:MAG: CHAT domain-containing protein [Bacteroidota bacterium]
MHWLRFKIRREHILSFLATSLLLFGFTWSTVEGQTSVWERSLRSELKTVHELLGEENGARTALDLLNQIPRFFPLISDSASASELRIQYAELTLIGLHKAQVDCDSLPERIEQTLLRSALDYRPGDMLKASFWRDQIMLQSGETGAAHGLALILLRDFQDCKTESIDSLKNVLSRVWKQKIDERWDLPFWSSPHQTPPILGYTGGTDYDEWINYTAAKWIGGEASKLETIYRVLEEREERLRQSQLRWLTFSDIYPKEEDPLPRLRAALYTTDSLAARIERDLNILKADSLRLLRDILGERKEADQASIAQFKADYPTFLSFWDKPEIPSLSSLQDQLKGPSDAFIRYYRLNRAVFILVVQKDKVDYFYVPISENFGAVLATLTTSIRQKPGPSVTDLLDSGLSLYQTLLAPADSLLSNTISNLIIAPPFRHTLPMEALIDQEPGLNELLPDWSFLIKRYAFCYVSSCAAWLASPGKEGRGPTKHYGGFSWDPTLDVDQDSIITWSEMSLNGNIRFTGQQEDVAQLAGFFGGDPYIGPEATLVNFRKKAKDYKILHMALPWKEEGNDHYWDEGLHLSGPGKMICSIRSICGLSLANSLVLCSSFPMENQASSLQPPPFEYLVGDAFQIGGAKALVYASWEAPSNTRQDIISRFFKYVKEGEWTASALQKAKKDFLSQSETPQLAHPYYWAAPVLYGPSSTVDLQKKNQDLLQIGLGLGALALLVFLIHTMGNYLRSR